MRVETEAIYEMGKTLCRGLEQSLQGYFAETAQEPLKQNKGHLETELRSVFGVVANAKLDLRRLINACDKGEM